MLKRNSILYGLDWLTILYFVVLTVIGWLSIYGASYDFEFEGSIFDFNQRAGKQFVWILTAFVLGGAILLIDYRLFNYFAYFIYAGVILLLIITIFIAPDIKGSRSWIVLGPVNFQSAELAKVATALVLARFMSRHNYKIRSFGNLIMPAFFIFLPVGLIILQKEVGSALLFAAFLLMFYREGMKGIVLLLVTLAVMLFIVIIRFSVYPIGENEGTLGIIIAMSIVILLQFVYAFFFMRHRKEGLILLVGIAIIASVTVVLDRWFIINFDFLAMAVTGASCVYWLLIELFKRYKKYFLLVVVTIVSIGFSYTADHIFNHLLEPHQQIRIKVLLNMEDDLAGAGYNVNQSKIAIGSGGFAGKGFLNGTQTKLKYVPEQDTDFIFCTVGEEHGFIGSVFVLIVYWLLLMRILKIGERQRESFNRIYAYCVASILFFHLMINVGMVLGLMPVIGIPLPFFSYGGSSLWGFTIMLFILLRLDASRMERGRYI